jgi:uncharacterized protein YcbK (DUF882 family)
MQITKNFNKREFNSKDGRRMPKDVLKNIIILAEQLQILRDHLQAPIHINSAYRSPQHNKRIGGVKNSQHIYGRAADITSRDYTPKQLHTEIERLIAKGEMLEGGLGLYNGFVHYDIRGYKARWNYTN